MKEIPRPKQRESESPTSRQSWNIVTDTITGPNIRLSDNVTQAIAIVVAIFLGAGIGYAVSEDGRAGIMLGGIAGLFAGAMLSGAALMLYRGLRHLRGKHD